MIIFALAITLVTCIVIIIILSVALHYSCNHTHRLELCHRELWQVINEIIKEQTDKEKDEQDEN